MKVHTHIQATQRRVCMPPKNREAKRRERKNNTSSKMQHRRNVYYKISIRVVGDYFKRSATTQKTCQRTSHRELTAGPQQSRHNVFIPSFVFFSFFTFSPLHRREEERGVVLSLYSDENRLLFFGCCCKLCLVV
jgi:hypothetical protein